MATRVVSADTTLVGVVGGGQMGAGIAEVCARAGLPVVVKEADAHARLDAQERIESSLRRALQKRKLSDTAHADAVARLRYTSELEDLAECDLVIEAVIEDPELKLQIHRSLDEVVPTHTILASNTSSIPIVNIAMATNRPDRVIGMHFFNPVPVLPLVEIVPSLRTSEATTEWVTGFAESMLGKQVIVSPDRAGFVVNTLLVPYLLSAIRMLESGFASASEIDAGMRLGCAHPMGPLELADLIGLDTTSAIAQSMYEEFKHTHYAPPALLLRMVKAQHLGRKTGRGFHEYPDNRSRT